jgi:hypothetical protein
MSSRQRFAGWREQDAATIERDYTASHFIRQLINPDMQWLSFTTVL